MVYDTEWVDDINKNYRKYVEECYVNMGNRQGGQRRPNNQPRITRNVEELNGYIANLRRNNNDDGPENFEEVVNMLNAGRHINTQHGNRINNIKQREHQMNENLPNLQNATTSVTNKLELMDEQDKIHSEKMKKLDKELDEMKQKNKERNEKA